MKKRTRCIFKIPHAFRIKYIFILYMFYKYIDISNREHNLKQKHWIFEDKEI